MDLSWTWQTTSSFARPEFLKQVFYFLFSYYLVSPDENFESHSWHFKIYIICLCNGAEVSMRPAYRSSKKVLVNDKLEAEVKKNRRMISLKETLLWTSSSVRYIWILMRIWGVLEQIICEYLSIFLFSLSSLMEITMFLAFWLTIFQFCTINRWNLFGQCFQ